MLSHSLQTNHDVVFIYLFNGFMEQQNKTVMHNGTVSGNSILSCTKGSWQLVPAPAKLQ